MSGASQAAIIRVCAACNISKVPMLGRLGRCIKVAAAKPARDGVRNSHKRSTSPLALPEIVNKIIVKIAATPMTIGALANAFSRVELPNKFFKNKTPPALAAQTNGQPQKTA